MTPAPTRSYLRRGAPQPYNAASRGGTVDVKAAPGATPTTQRHSSPTPREPRTTPNAKRTTADDTTDTSRAETTGTRRTAAPTRTKKKAASQETEGGGIGGEGSEEGLATFPLSWTLRVRQARSGLKILALTLPFPTPSGRLISFFLSRLRVTLLGAAPAEETHAQHEIQVFPHPPASRQMTHAARHTA